MAGLGWLLASPLEERRDWLRLRGRTGQKSFPRGRLGRRPAVWGFYAWQYSGCPMKAGNLSESDRIRPHLTLLECGIIFGGIPAGAISRKGGLIWGILGSACFCGAPGSPPAPRIGEQMAGYAGADPLAAQSANARPAGRRWGPETLPLLLLITRQASIGSYSFLQV